MVFSTQGGYDLQRYKLFGDYKKIIHNKVQTGSILDIYNMRIQIHQVVIMIALIIVAKDVNKKGLPFNIRQPIAWKRWDYCSNAAAVTAAITLKIMTSNVMQRTMIVTMPLYFQYFLL